MTAPTFDAFPEESEGRGVCWILAFALAALIGCGPDPSGPSGPAAESAESAAAQTETAPARNPEENDAVFRSETESRGVDFSHWDGRTGERFMIETAGSGGGFFDFDDDGDLDLYLINGRATPFHTGQPGGTGQPGDTGQHGGGEYRNALFANDGQGHFTDVTATSGTGDPGYGMGLCVGDYDRDGRLDFMVTNFGPDRLYRNLGGGKFEEVAASAGVDGERWGTNCAFADVDRDGDLDLYVANYVDFSFEENPRCGDQARQIWSYCQPKVFDGQVDYLYINEGDGTFSEQGVLRGLAQGTEDRGFGVLASDLDGDGAPEILVANDGTLNRLYVNDGAGQFTEQGLVSGLAADREGLPGSGMGMDLGDVDGDGLVDLIVTNYSFEANTLFLRSGYGLYFEDRTREASLARPSYLSVGWGAQFFDADNDGDLDLAIANGHVMDNIDLFEDAVGYPQPNFLFVNDGEGAFQDLSARGGPGFEVAKVSRALAVGDVDSDGRLDLLITQTNDAPDLLRNVWETSNHWVGLRLVGGPDDRFALGASATLSCDGRSMGRREVRSGGSYLAQSDLRLHFGLGQCRGPVSYEVRWPNGRLQQGAVEVDRYSLVEYALTDEPKAAKASVSIRNPASSSH